MSRVSANAVVILSWMSSATEGDWSRSIHAENISTVGVLTVAGSAETAWAACSPLSRPSEIIWRTTYTRCKGACLFSTPNTRCIDVMS